MFSDPREGISQLESKFINIKELKEKLSEDLLNSIVLFYKYKKKKKKEVQRRIMTCSRSQNQSINPNLLDYGNKTFIIKHTYYVIHRICGNGLATIDTFLFICPKCHELHKFQTDIFIRKVKNVFQSQIQL